MGGGAYRTSNHIVLDWGRREGYRNSDHIVWAPLPDKEAYSKLKPHRAPAPDELACGSSNHILPDWGRPPMGGIDK